MATDLAEILADLRAEASRSPRHDPAVAADARTALSRLRPALDRLRDDGLDTGASIDVDPDAFSRQADRVHWVRLLAVTCDTLGRSIPAPESRGRLTDLADAAAVAATLHVDTLTGGERWATVAALARTAHVLTDAAAGGEQESSEVSRALIIAEASSSVLFQFAALDPPAAFDYAAIHRPVPDPSARPASVEAAALEASAALVHATRPGTGPHPIAEILAIATAATTACQFVAATHPGDEGVSALANNAARAWADVRDRLTPFNDGSRRPQPLRPPAVESALALYRALQPTASVSVQTPQGVATHERLKAGIGVVVDRIAMIAERLDAAVVDGVSSGRLMAYAVDLPMREGRVGPFLERRRTAGLVTVDGNDIAPARAALVRARASAVALSVGVSAPSAGAEPDHARPPGYRHSQTVARPLSR